MTWGLVIAGVGTVAAGAMSASAAGDAADAQAEYAASATGEQRRQFNLNRQDIAPFMNTGTAANSRLAYLMGIGDPAAEAKLKAAKPDDVTLAYREILGRNPEAGGHAYYKNQLDQGMTIDQIRASIAGSAENQQEHGTYTQDPAEAAAIAAAEAEFNAPKTGEYGSLLRKFSQADIDADPVYQSGLQFGLKQGTDGINSRAIAGGGGYDSGATLKALTRYANDYGSTKANESFNRFNIANDSIYNKLAGVSGAGQQATSQAVASGTNMANNVSGLMTDAGNARAAGIIGGANAWGDAAGSVGKQYNNYNTNEWLKGLTKQNSTTGSAFRYTVPTYEGAEY